MLILDRMQIYQMFEIFMLSAMKSTQNALKRIFSFQWEISDKNYKIEMA